MDRIKETKTILTQVFGLTGPQLATMTDGDYGALHARATAENPPDCDLRICLEFARLELAQYRYVRAMTAGFKAKTRSGGFLTDNFRPQPRGSIESVKIGPHVFRHMDESRHITGNSFVAWDVTPGAAGPIIKAPEQVKWVGGGFLHPLGEPMHPKSVKLESVILDEVDSYPEVTATIDPGHPRRLDLNVEFQLSGNIEETDGMFNEDTDEYDAPFYREGDAAIFVSRGAVTVAAGTEYRRLTPDEARRVVENKVRCTGIGVRLRDADLRVGDNFVMIDTSQFRRRLSEAVAKCEGPQQEKCWTYTDGAHTLHLRTDGPDIKLALGRHRLTLTPKMVAVALDESDRHFINLADPRGQDWIVYSKGCQVGTGESRIAMPPGVFYRALKELSAGRR